MHIALKIIIGIAVVIYLFRIIWALESIARSLYDIAVILGNKQNEDEDEED